MQISQYILTNPSPSYEQEFALNIAIFVRVTFVKLNTTQSMSFAEKDL
jgi:hypothetical protein